MIQERVFLKIINNDGKSIILPNLILGQMTTNTNGYETLTFSFMSPAAFDRTPFVPKNWVGVYLPFFGSKCHGEFFVDEIKIPSSDGQGELVRFDVTCYGMQHIAKTNYPLNNASYSGAGKADPITICQDAELGGRLLTALGVTSTAYVTQSTGTLISQKIDKLKVRNIGDWFTEILAYGDGTYMWDWAFWVDSNYGLRSTAQRTQIYLTKRDHITPIYYVDRADITVDAPLVMSFNQYWDNAIFHYTGNGSADTTTTATAPAGTLPNFHCILPNGTEIPLTHVYGGDLGIPGGDATVTVSTAQAAQRAQAEFNADLSYALTSASITINPDKITDVNGHVIPNETVRAGRVIRIRNKAVARTEGLYIDLFITQTSLDLVGGQLSITPQTSTDFKSNWGNPYKKKGSAHHKHQRNINPY